MTSYRIYKTCLLVTNFIKASVLSWTVPSSGMRAEEIEAPPLPELLGSFFYLTRSLSAW